MAPPGAGARRPRAPAVRSVDLDKAEIRDWESLLGDGSVRRLHLTIGEMNEAFGKSGNQAAAGNPEPGDRTDTFIDLYVALVSVPTIGRSLLGDEGYEQLKARLKPGQQAIVVAGDGAYSFKGSGYVRGGIFDRIELLQDGRARASATATIRGSAISRPRARRSCARSALFVSARGLHPRSHRTLAAAAARSARRGAREKAFLTFDLAYTLPEKISPDRAAGNVGHR